MRLLPRLLNATVLLAAVLGCLATAGPGQAAWPGENGAIAFSHNANNGRAGGDIWIQARSGREHQLTNARQANDGEPTYSRDGHQIAFSRYSGGDFDIWVMNSNGSNKHPVTETNGNVSETEPAFLPSGRSLVFAKQGVAGGSRVYSVRTDGSRPKMQANNGRSPVVSPDGRWLAYRRHPGGNRIRLKNLRTRKERKLSTGIAQEPDFSPDGSRLVFVGKRPCGGQLRQSLLTIGLHDRHPRMLYETCHRSFVAYSPAWSPNGNRIVFTRLSRRDLTQGASDVRLQMVNLAGILVGGAPRPLHQAYEDSPSWQPLR